MKIVIVAALILVSLSLLLGTNAIVSAKIADSLENSLNILYEHPCSEHLNDFEDLWNSYDTYFRLTIDSNKIRTLNTGISLIKASNNINAPSQFYFGINYIKEAILEIKDSTSFKLSNIF